MAVIRGPGQTSNNNHVNTQQDPPSTKDNEEDDNAIKKQFIMELNEKFGLLMCTKVDAQTVIMKVKEKFPLDTLFERYEDELAILFNETAFRGSTKNKQTTTLTRCKQASNNNQQNDHDENIEVL
ncbi:hypothetical protein L6452_26061 [Arctium lappa]|uniref:Uncharacterized protein n=1 Tax=Arctium lappa TaxID=4217 RepID=A0ACB9ACW9_ARCLA|nr:hypothetical protein L6452_26061 [Arctium lappa]